MRRIFLIKITNVNIQSIRRDNPDKYVDSKTQTCNERSADYMDIKFGYKDSLSVTLSHKSTKIKSEYYQLIGSLLKLFTC